MRVTARVDYAVRAGRELALSHPGTLSAEAIAARQELPLAFTKQIMARMRRAGIVVAQRGGEGGYRLGPDPAMVSVADIVRAVEGPLADVHGTPPEELDYVGSAVALQKVWVATRAALRSILEEVSIADIAQGSLPAVVEPYLDVPDAWSRR